MEPLVACLLPVRNGAEHLPDWFESVRGFADTVVALDDGSTDSTPSVLESSELVSVLLRNPRRESYQGWDDSANRNRLLAAAADIRPRWIMQLDADERLDTDDARALRHFIEKGAKPGCGYSFQTFRMFDDCQHWDKEGTWLARLFAFELGQSFPTQRLHLRQLPTSIPRTRTFRTTLRIQHLAGMTHLDREARIQKYAEADPASLFHPNYKALDEVPKVVHRWARRPPGLPVLFNGCAEPLDITSPALTTVVIAREDADTIEGSLSAIDEQRSEVDLEVVVVVSGSASTAQAARHAMPSVEVVELEQSVPPGEARNIGLARATGSVVSFPGSHVCVSPGSLAARLAAHRRGYAMVTGTVRNGTDTFAGWATYFLEFSRSLPGLPAGRLEFAPVTCSYLRAVLEWAGGFPAWRSAEDTEVNQRLWAYGFGAYRDPAIEFVHLSPCHSVSDFFRHQLVRGSGWGRLMKTLDASGRLRTRSGLRWALGMMPVVRMLSICRFVWLSRQRSMQLRFVLVSPLVFAGALVGWVQAWRTFITSTT